MRKVKAALSVLVGNNIEKMDKIVELYFQNSTIIVDEKENPIECEHYGFKEFLDRDERTNMQKEKAQYNAYYGSRSPKSPIWRLGELHERKFSKLVAQGTKHFEKNPSN